MRDKKKKTDKQIKVQDLKPSKDAKGGYPPGPCNPVGHIPGGHSPGSHIPPGPPTKKVKNRLVQLGAERFLLGAMMLILLPR
jgi:hypothetical protein